MNQLERQVLEVARNHLQSWMDKGNPPGSARVGSAEIAKELNSSPGLIYKAVMLLEQQGRLQLDQQLSRPVHEVAVINHVWD